MKELIIIIFAIIIYFIIFDNNFENFSNKEPKIIILIISSNNIEFYKNMREVWKKYMNNHPNITSFFIENDSSIDKDIIVDKKNNTIYYKDEESYIPGILNKTIKIMEYLIKNNDVDYIYRTNLSSVINLDKLYSYIQNNNNIDYAGHDYIKFISGSGIILSKKTCKILIEDKSLINNNNPDDYAIGLKLENLVEKKHIEYYGVSGLDDKIFNNDGINKINPDIFQFRCRFANEHDNTAQAMENVYNKLYMYIKLSF
jgi:hypothetical protein